MQLSKFIKERLALEEYSFSREEYMAYSGKDSKSITTDLSYLSSKGEIQALRSGFYVIIPPRYSKLGVIPLELYVDKLFGYIGKEYYLGLYSAARLHGASHQQTQIDYVVTQGSRMLDIQKPKLIIDFFLTSNWPEANIIKRKSDAGYFSVSDAVLTMADLIYHQSKLGGINRMLANIQELLEEVKINDLESLIQWYPHKSVLQRLGYIVETIDPENELLTPLYDSLNKNRFYPVLLNTAGTEKPGSVDNRWKVDINLELESDI